jgi:hypothetical protein
MVARGVGDFQMKLMGCMGWGYKKILGGAERIF